MIERDLNRLFWSIIERRKTSARDLLPSARIKSRRVFTSFMGSLESSVHFLGTAERFILPPMMMVEIWRHILFYPDISLGCPAFISLCYDFVHFRDLKDRILCWRQDGFSVEGGLTCNARVLHDKFLKLIDNNSIPFNSIDTSINFFAQYFHAVFRSSVYHLVSLTLSTNLS